jgi:hypothetical protein
MMRCLDVHVADGCVDVYALHLQAVADRRSSGCWQERRWAMS